MKAMKRSSDGVQLPNGKYRWGNAEVSFESWRRAKAAQLQRHKDHGAWVRSKMQEKHPDVTDGRGKGMTAGGTISQKKMIKSHVDLGYVPLGTTWEQLLAYHKIPNLRDHKPKKSERRDPVLRDRTNAKDQKVGAKGAYIREQFENRDFTNPLIDYLNALGGEKAQTDLTGADIVWLNFAIEVKRKTRDFKYAMKVIVDAQRLSSYHNRKYVPVIVVPSEPSADELSAAEQSNVLVWRFDPKKLEATCTT